MLEGFAELAYGQHQWECGALLWASAERLREEIGAPLPPQNKEKQERKVAEARAALGEAAFATAWETGRAMTWEGAIAYALEESRE